MDYQNDKRRRFFYSRMTESRQRASAQISEGRAGKPARSLGTCAVLISALLPLVLIVIENYWRCDASTSEGSIGLAAGRSPCCQMLYGTHLPAKRRPDLKTFI
ncbi:hypothetical protein J2S89_002741 [Arthrobacter bambusae]|nr:hypothetical protein [Arthrobacter bambusae]MDQ0099267.1 hypothetical protein [Arthrobacter bambusae]